MCSGHHCGAPTSSPPSFLGTQRSVHISPLLLGGAMWRVQADEMWMKVTQRFWAEAVKSVIVLFHPPCATYGGRSWTEVAGPRDWSWVHHSFTVRRATALKSWPGAAVNFVWTETFLYCVNLLIFRDCLLPCYKTNLCHSRIKKEDPICIGDIH